MKKRCLYVAIIAIIIDVLFRVAFFDLLFNQSEIALFKPYWETITAIEIYFSILFFSLEAREEPIKVLIGFLLLSSLFRVIDFFLDTSSYPHLISLALSGAISYLIYRLVKVDEKVE